MSKKIRDVMSRNPTIIDARSSAMDAARQMRDQHIGDVLVERDGALCGILTDRDLVMRVLAEGKDPSRIRAGEVCSSDRIVTLGPSDDVERALTMMRERAIRRIPIVESGRPVGIVSMGDLALDRDPDSALASVSAAPPNT